MIPAESVHIEAERLTLRLPGPDEAAAVIAYHRANSDFHAPYRTATPDGWLDETAMRVRLARARTDYAEDRAFKLLAFARDDGRVVGQVSFSHIQRGPLQLCTLGFGLGEREQGQGLMTEALRAAIDFVWRELRLHRIEASHLPDNERSARVLARVGFVVEGYARDFVFGGGRWHDQVRTSLINPDPAFVPEG